MGVHHNNCWLLYAHSHTFSILIIPSVYCSISLFVAFQVWSVEKGERLSYQHDCQDFYVKPCVFYNDSNKIASAKKPGRIRVRGEKCTSFHLQFMRVSIGLEYD